MDLFAFRLVYSHTFIASHRRFGVSGRNFICKHMRTFTYPVYVRIPKKSIVKTFTAALVHANINSSLSCLFVCFYSRACVRACVYLLLCLMLSKIFK